MFDYTEITRKNGQKLVFCRFEDLIPEAFGCSIEELMTQGAGQHEFVGHCPFCRAEGHKKHKLYISSDLEVGHCFVCTRAFRNINDNIDVHFEVPSFMSCAENSSQLVLRKLNDPDWTIEKYYTEFDDYSEKGINYLIGRHPFMKDLWKILEFKFLNDNVVIPFKYHNELIYYQIRFTGKNTGGIRYFHPHIETGCKPPYIIESGACDKFIICEGVFDAISLLIQAPGYTPFAVLGSAITDYQLAFLREYLPKKILIMMDETKISRKIADKVRKVIDYCPVEIIPTYGNDPEEIMKYKMSHGQDLFWIK
jgi:hypothetical protein